MKVKAWRGGPAWIFLSAPSATAEALVHAVRREGDRAVRRFVLRYDGRLPKRWRYDRAELRSAARAIPADLRRALQEAARRIRRVAEAQKPREAVLRDGAGEIRLRSLPLGRVGVYVPGGRYPLLSTALMGVIPARAAGVREILVCTPAGPSGEVPLSVRAAAGIAGADALFAVGGGQAVAAMACGTRSIPRVDKIVGPGNRHVAAAKKAVRDLGLCGIDGVAGPSEILVVADASARADWIAADLLAQAEHDPDAKLALATPSRALAFAVQRTVAEGLKRLSTRAVAAHSLARATAWVVRSLEQATVLSEATAPEHLLLWCRKSRRLQSRFTRFGTMCVGPYSTVAFGDYVNGPNHTLPTDGTARWASGLAVLDFLRPAAVQTVSRSGARHLASPACRLAEVEGLVGHRDAAEIRTRSL